MNYYKHHLGDYSKDTPHLTILEHGAYRVLMDYCYISEKPLPLDMERLYSIVRASRPQERKVVDSVLAEFFIKDETGYHHKRIDEELDKYREKATQNKANGNRGGRPKITQPVSKDEPKNNLNHKPITNNQEPIKHTPSKATAVCVALRSEGIRSDNSQHPELLDLLENGAEIEDFASAARTAKDRGKGFGYVLGIVRNSMSDAHRNQDLTRQPSGTAQAIAALEAMK